MRDSIRFVCLLFIVCVIGCAEEKSETMENVQPPAIFYHGETSQRWFEVSEKGQIVQTEELGAIRFQNLELCDIVGTVSYVESNVTSLTEELSVNLTSSVDIGTPVYSTIIDGKLWLIVEGEYGGERYQFYFGTWSLQKERNE